MYHVSKGTAGKQYQMVYVTIIYGNANEIILMFLNEKRCKQYMALFMIIQLKSSQCNCTK